MPDKLSLNNFPGFIGITGYSSSAAAPSFYSWHIGGNITSLESVAAVPETSTWMMLILGFAMVGFALRKRNSSQTAMKEKMFTFMQNKEGAMHAPSGLVGSYESDWGFPVAL